MPAVRRLSAQLAHLRPHAAPAPAADAASSSDDDGVTIASLPPPEAASMKSFNARYCLHTPEQGSGAKLPLLIYLHGGGGTGHDIEKPRRQIQPLLASLRQANIAALVVAPQTPAGVKTGGGWLVPDLDSFLAHLLATLPADPDRVYLTGNSMGGYGTYLWAGSQPQHFAAIAPMVGGLGSGGPLDVTAELDSWGRNLATLPMWAYYGEDDEVVPADRGAMVMGAIERAGGELATLTVLESRGHNAGQVPYGDPAFFEWLFSHRRK